MTSFIHDLVTNRLGRLRVCVLYLLAMTVLAMALGLSLSRNTSPAGGKGEKPLAPDALAGLVVAVDPGHGGYDGGARAHDSGIWEKALTLQIALRVEEVLTAHGAKVVLTRREDVALGEKAEVVNRQRKRRDLQARLDAALQANATVLLSIHLNEYRSRKESGPQVFYQYGGEDGRMLAGVLQAALLADWPPKRQVAGGQLLRAAQLHSSARWNAAFKQCQEEALLTRPTSASAWLWPGAWRTGWLLPAGPHPRTPLEIADAPRAKAAPT